MDLDPNNFPILAFVLSQIDPNSHPYLPPQIHQNLNSQFPQLTNPKVLSSLTQSIPQNLHQTLSLLKSLGARPDPSSVSSARAKINEFEQKGIDESNTEVGIFRAVLRLDNMHEECERELRSVEESLVRVYKDAVEEEAEEEVDEEIVRVLKEAESGNVVERVNLSERGLRFVPEGFGKIQGLLVLNLSHNQIEVIPDAIAGLRNLQELDISSNLLVSIPDSIGLLINLKVLNISANKLNALPESIAGCSALRELDVGFNDLSWLPTNIGYGLTSLEKLLISLNKIRILPLSICEIKSLRYLDAHFNGICGLPNAIGRLSNLEVLNLSSNFSDLTELPETLGDLGNLRELDLSNNQIRVLPDSFYRLENLNKVNLEQNPLEVPPLEVANKGAKAVKEFMRNRWDDMIAEGQLRSIREASAAEAQSGWIGWGSALISDFVSGVSQTVSGYVGGGNAPRDPYLDQQL